MLIRIKAGTASYYDGRKRHLLSPADGAVDVPDAVANRWVKMGSAIEIEPEPSVQPETDSEPQVAGDGPDYSRMTANELREECEARGIDVPPRARKASLVAILSEADQLHGFTPFEPQEAE